MSAAGGDGRPETGPGASGKGQPPALFMASLLANDETWRTEAVRRLCHRFGPLIYWSGPLPFAGAAYLAEFGPGLTRRLAFFAQPVATHELARLKRITRSLEADLALQGRRRVNIDPGLVTADAVILASGKGRGHRVALAPDIFAEMALYYHQGAYKGLPWTYRDFAGAAVLDVLHRLRSRHLWRLRQAAEGK